MNDDLFVNIIIGIVGIIVLVAILKWPYIGVAISIAVLQIIHIFPNIPLFSSISIPVGVVTLAAYLLQSKERQKRHKRKLEPVYLFGFLFIFWTVVTNPEASILSPDRIWLITFVQLWVLMYLGGEVLVTPKHQETTMLIFAITSTVSALFAILQGQIAEDALSSARVAGLAVNANQAARYFVIAFVCYFYLRSKSGKPLPKFLFLVGMVITFAGVFFTVSRSGILLLLGAVALIIIFQPRVKNRISLLVLLIIGLIVLNVFSESIFQIIRDIFPAIRMGTDTVGLRYSLWEAGWKMWLDHPINGVGVGQYNSNLLQYMQLIGGPERGGLSPHNTYVHVLSETGIVGFFLFMAMLVNAIKNLWPSHSRLMEENEHLRNTWFIILLIISVGGITITDLANKILWLVLGVSVAFSKQKTIEATDQVPESVQPSKTSATSIRIRRWLKSTK